MSHPVLILGGGIGGITAALELAEAGQEVVLVEKESYLGGNVSQFHNYFPKLCPPSCGLEINYRRIRVNPRITYYTDTTLKQLEGSVGNFKVTLETQPRLVNDNCTACGKCADVCPVERPGGKGVDKGEKAAYIRDGIPFPYMYTIDAGVCRKEACEKCLEVCDSQAIDLDAAAVEIVLQIHAVILATGWQLYDANRLENYPYREDPDILTNLEFEHLMASTVSDQRELTRPSDGRLPERIAFIQCAGSRDQHHLAYCSAVCCSATIKHVLTLAEHYPGISTEVFYIDLRLTGRNEVLLQKAEKHGSVRMTKGKVGRISRDPSGNQLLIEVEDVMSGSRRVDSFDLVVLAAGMVPNPVPLDLQRGPEGFIEPVQQEGIYPAGSCKRPMDVATTVRDATGAVLKAMQR
jgi:quinone-modifying oxidoreductase subunit QmoA